MSSGVKEGERGKTNRLSTSALNNILDIHIGD